MHSCAALVVGSLFFCTMFYYSKTQLEPANPETRQRIGYVGVVLLKEITPYCLLFL